MIFYRLDQLWRRATSWETIHKICEYMPICYAISCYLSVWVCITMGCQWVYYLLPLDPRLISALALIPARPLALLFFDFSDFPRSEASSYVSCCTHIGICWGLLLCIIISSKKIPAPSSSMLPYYCLPFETPFFWRALVDLIRLPCHLYNLSSVLAVACLFAEFTMLFLESDSQQVVVNQPAQLAIIHITVLFSLIWKLSSHMRNIHLVIAWIVVSSIHNLCE